ncbi:unnamed protein product [Ceratitis capitata]|uniref:(Mediterranean fruit fly) hypothetical protein n=1 Tax=Ceratitis capitata TaxID=7213 RepID=A0A811VBL1_CERCA|nr:unnamed protein product [Ceratitis capitata]
MLNNGEILDNRSCLWIFLAGFLSQLCDFALPRASGGNSFMSEDHRGKHDNNSLLWMELEVTSGNELAFSGVVGVDWRLRNLLKSTPKAIARVKLAIYLSDWKKTTANRCDIIFWMPILKSSDRNTESLRNPFEYTIVF